MIPSCSPTQQPQPKGPHQAPPGLSQLEPQDRFEPGRPGTPDFLVEFQKAMVAQQAEKARERAMAEQMLKLLQGGGR